ncbi:MAG: hypothetical protein OJF50_006374 [Nitrospira sp.]|nr:hypothetical protein [Nitrospira sp.]
MNSLPVRRCGLKGGSRLLQLGRALKKAGSRIGELVEILAGAARPILDRWCESQEWRATLATDAQVNAPTIHGQ